MTLAARKLLGVALELVVKFAVVEEDPVVVCPVVEPVLHLLYAVREVPEVRVTREDDKRGLCSPPVLEPGAVVHRAQVSRRRQLGRVRRCWPHRPGPRPNPVRLVVGPRRREPADTCVFAVSWVDGEDEVEEDLARQPCHCRRGQPAIKTRAHSRERPRRRRRNGTVWE